MEDNIKKWDKYFLDVCNTVASNSKCLSRKIGVILVRDKSIISTGYNGAPSGVPHCDRRLAYDGNLRDLFVEKGKDHSFMRDWILDECPRYLLGAKSGEMRDICPSVHSEANAIVNAAKNGVCTERTIMYMSCSIPCFECLKLIINAGIREIVVTGLNYYDNMSEFLLTNSTLKYRVYGEISK